jgi:hypothetical protein
VVLVLGLVFHSREKYHITGYIRGLQAKEETMECTVIAVIAGALLMLCEPPTKPEPKKEEKEDVRRGKQPDLRVPSDLKIPEGKRTPV